MVERRKNPDETIHAKPSDSFPRSCREKDINLPPLAAREQADFVERYFRLVYYSRWSTFARLSDKKKKKKATQILSSPLAFGFPRDQCNR